MSLQAGHKLAHYEILEPIGKGGMGEVYRAKDSKLGRDVAIKVLPDEFARDDERLRRFQREAKVLASLNHPSIASIYGVEQSGETHYLVLELVPGETLAERISRGPIPLEEALEIARKIAEALEEAHEHRIVHRDLKPANVKLTPDDKIKVLDFGLAKAFAEETPEADSSTSPTITRDATRAGVILGTASYMSPEQAKGKPVDTRADIFAFGAVLYEMLTGKRAFPGDDVSEVLASVIKLEPDWEAVPTELPPAGDRLLRRCMTKSLHHRLQHIGDARLDIEEAFGAPSKAVSDYRFNAISAGSMIVAVLAAGIALWSLSRPDQSVPRTVTRASIALAVGDEFHSDNTSSVAISPDGLKLAYIARRSNTTQLFLRRVDQLEAELIDGTEGAQTPFFSPDSQWVGFFSRGKIMKVAVSGGAPTIVSEVGYQIRGACWTTADEIIFNTGLGQGLSRVFASGGEPQRITNPDHERREKTHRLPEPLPGGDKVLFTLASADIDSFDDASIAVLSVETGEYHVVLEGGTHARYSSSGHLVYGRAGSLLAVPFHLETARVTGSPVPVEDGVSVSTIYGNAHFGISGSGALIYTRGKAVGVERRVVWVDREGGERSLIETPGNYESVRISPDGRLLALWVEGANASIWVHDLARTTSTRLTFGFDNYFPVWSPDSLRVAFASTRTVPANVFWQRADGSGEAERLTNSDIIQYPSSWSPDGSVLAVTSGSDIDVLSLDGERISEPFLRTRFSEGFSVFSPNGEWIAYNSNESGQNEVYVRPFPASMGKTQVSSGGGALPRWSSDGELFYRNGRKMMSVEVDTDGDIRLGEARLLFEKATVTQYYDVTPDGDQFAMIVPSEPETPTTELILVQNWTEELERVVPQGN